jgi:hypothetical protein
MEEPIPVNAKIKKFGIFFTTSCSVVVPFTNSHILD